MDVEDIKIDDKDYYRYIDDDDFYNPDMQDIDDKYNNDTYYLLEHNLKKPTKV
jgi:hypothetical protein